MNTEYLSADIFQLEKYRNAYQIFINKVSRDFKTCLYTFELNQMILIMTDLFYPETVVQ